MHRNNKPVTTHEHYIDGEEKLPKMFCKQNYLLNAAVISSFCRDKELLISPAYLSHSVTDF
ncbi:MAG: hypothetical protein WKF91_15625 [Segetibacter sp.]